MIKKGILCFLLLCMLGSSAVLAKEETVVVDNDDAQNTEIYLNGNIVEDYSEAGIKIQESAAAVSGTYYTASKKQDEIKLVYKPTLYKGKYEVFINRPQIGAANTDMICEINAADGTYTPSFSNLTGGMENDEPGYISVGVYNFGGEYGTDTVALTKEAGKGGIGKFARWDSVKFVLVERETEPANSKTVVLSCFDTDETNGRHEMSGWYEELEDERAYGGKIIRSHGAPGDLNVTYLPVLDNAKYRVYLHKFTGESWGQIAITINSADGVKETGCNLGAYYNQVTNDNMWIELGEFTFSGEAGQDSVVIKSGSWGYARADAVKFEPVRKIDLIGAEAFGSDAANGVPWGADEITVNLTNTAEEYGSDSVWISGKDGTLASSFDVRANKINISLAESLCANEEYTIHLKGITDLFGNAMSEKEISFAAVEGSEGKAEMNVTSCIFDGNMLNIAGEVYSSKGIGIKGRNVKISCEKDSSERYEFSAVSQDNGIFEIAVPTSEFETSGIYNVSVTTDFAEEYSGYSFGYINAADFEKLCAEINSADTYEKVKSFFEALGKIVTLPDTSDLPEDTAIYTYFTDKNYDNIYTVISDFKKMYVIQKINYAANSGEIENIFGNAEYLGFLEYESDFLDVMENTKASFAQKVFECENFSSCDEAINKINEIYNDCLLNEYNKPRFESPFENRTVTVGQSVDFDLNFSEELIGVKSIECAFSSETPLFKDFYADSDMKYAIDRSDKAVNVRFDFETPSSIKNVGQMYFTAEDEFAGTHTIKAEITVNYEIDGVSRTVYYNAPAKNITLTVNQNNKTSSGGGSGGGGSSGPVSSIKPPYVKPTDDNKDDNKSDEVKSPFADMNGEHWGYEAVNALYNAKIITGVDEKHFAPESNVTREEFVALILRAKGITDYAGTTSFKDADKDAWYYEYVCTAEAEGIINGTEDGIFGIGEYITRQDMAVIIARTWGIEPSESENIFNDETDIADYASGYVHALYEKNIINGTGNGDFEPNGYATRAMAAKMIYEIWR